MGRTSGALLEHVGNVVGKAMGLWLMLVHCIMINVLACTIMFSMDARILSVMLCLAVLTYLLYLYHDGNCVVTLLEQRFMGNDIDYFIRGIRNVIPLGNMEKHSRHVALTGTAMVAEIVVCALKLIVILAFYGRARRVEGRRS